ncbi:MAG: valine--tRNA ligase, partial [Firmicutes bacterium]|nr:valine--tRNA ligase [Bacillota bacterium]
MALDKRYDHKIVEENKYETWKSKGYFTAGDKSKPRFSMVIPPPNVTGKLHLGHAWNTTIQDILARYKRAKGFDVLWLPGMDHAGIATQAKVEAKLRKKGISRFDLGREGFLKEAWAWKKEYAEDIHWQWSVMGLAIDYSRERFTLDEGLNEAVREVFVDLYKKGLIYRGERIINWDPVQMTALSNIEVIHSDDEGEFYYFLYRFEGQSEGLVVATTRPETMFGDVCLVVNPKDERFIQYVGKKVINPANGQLLPIIADDYVDMNFGTGAMKCTPAHDPNDFIIGEKHHLEHPICLNKDATMNALAGKYQGQDRFECRKHLVKQIEKEGNLVKIEHVVHPVGHSERSGAVIEPYLSKQWFVKMRPLAEQALKFQEGPDAIKFYPDRFGKVFSSWMDKAEDWCISRQLWWGHQIPAYYHKETGEVLVSVKPPKDIQNYTQDDDVLDTWFSSALWPFSTLGWPRKTQDLARYFPIDVMVTAYDIIFFWVSRMIFQSLEFTGKKPFNDVLIHGLIRDAQGRKMSKSLGNGVDPIEIIDSYGADALRYFLTTNSTPGQDTRYIEEK